MGLAADLPIQVVGVHAANGQWEAEVPARGSGALAEDRTETPERSFEPTAQGQGLRMHGSAALEARCGRGSAWPSTPIAAAERVVRFSTILFAAPRAVLRKDRLWRRGCKGQPLASIRSARRREKPLPFCTHDVRPTTTVTVSVVRWVPSPDAGLSTLDSRILTPEQAGAVERRTGQHDAIGGSPIPCPMPHAPCPMPHAVHRGPPNTHEGSRAPQSRLQILKSLCKYHWLRNLTASSTDMLPTLTGMTITTSRSGPSHYAWTSTAGRASQRQWTCFGCIGPIVRRQPSRMPYLQRPSPLPFLCSYHLCKPMPVLPSRYPPSAIRHSPSAIRCMPNENKRV
ncbi:hypothetical protein ST47_g3810 [Ascochyta rabiei]|uniref:Uncharacterized protein n=1 Tax=Didymella rabiei TaxID=5454 RepID=A0A163GYV8_DIDRA|nr:hypothetical protein ST47_g3810 [Ascochyta rabiei]